MVAIETYGISDWNRICQFIGTKTIEECQLRWKEHLSKMESWLLFDPKNVTVKSNSVTNNDVEMVTSVNSEFNDETIYSNKQDINNGIIGNNDFKNSMNEVPSEPPIVTIKLEPLPVIILSNVKSLTVKNKCISIIKKLNGQLENEITEKTTHVITPEVSGTAKSLGIFFEFSQKFLNNF